MLARPTSFETSMIWWILGRSKSLSMRITFWPRLAQKLAYQAAKVVFPSRGSAEVISSVFGWRDTFSR